MKKVVYFDNAATTPVRAEVMAGMLTYFGHEFANPASHYRFATKPFNELDEARAKVANAIGAAEASEIYFTGSGTEADNWAIQGVAQANAKKGKHIITTEFEHHAVLETCKYLESKGFEVTYIKPDSDGMIDPEDIKNAIRPDTVLVSCIYANNEVGTIQPIAEIGKIARAAGVLFHTDAVQAVGHIPVDVVGDSVDLLSLAAHKFYGPKGVGALYIRKGVKIAPMIFGGMQEGNKRAGTHNVPGIVALGIAIDYAIVEMKSEAERLQSFRDKLINGIIKTIPHTKLNGGANRLPGIVNISFRFIESEAILNLLDFKGICASSGSACNSDTLEASHVMIAMGISHEEANGTVRFSLGRYNTEADVDYLLATLPPIIQKLRDMSPLYDDFKRNK